MTLRRLVVIEAPSKAATLEGILREVEFEARVQATRGHLYASPFRANDPLGVDSGFREFARLPVNDEVVERLRLEAREADEVYVATDADVEGDVIAWDVVTTIRDIHPNCMRIRLKGMDRESVLTAIQERSPVDRRDAIPGRTRALVDRMIGVTFSRRDVKVGRISTGMLGLVAKTKPSVKRLNLAAPARKGGAPYLASCDLDAIVDDQVAAALVSLTLPALDLESSAPTKTNPGHTGDILIRAGDRLDISPTEAMQSMQKMYEGGRLSYPRSSSRSMSPSACVKFASIMRKSGYHLVEGQYVKKADTDVHDAPHPIGKVDVSADPTRLGTDEGMRTLIAGDLVRAGLTRRAERPALAPLEDFLATKGFRKEVVAKIVSLDWKREVGPRYPGEVSWSKSGIETRRADTVLLEKSCEAGLGRPSTWAKHVEKFLSRGLVDESLGLTRKGQEWVAGSPSLLLDPRISAAIENACEKCPGHFMDDPDRDPWEMLAQAIVTNLPPALKEPLVAMIAHEDPRPRYDPAREFARREMEKAGPAVDPNLSKKIDEALVNRLVLEMD